MKRKQKKTNKLLLVITGIIVGLLAVSGVTYALFIAPNQTQDGSSSTVENDTQNTNSSQDNSSKSSDNKPTSSNTDTPVPTTQDPTSGKQVVEMVTYVDISGDMVSIRGGINNASVSTGSCYAKLVGPNGEAIEKPTSLLQNASTTDCKTISLDSNSISKGTWKITLNYTSDQMEGQSNEASITIK